MKTSFGAISAVAAFILYSVLCDISLALEPNAGVRYQDSQVLVRFKPAIAATAKSAAHAQAQAVRVLREYHIVDGLQLVEVPEGQVFTAVAAYANNSNVFYAEPDYFLPLAETIPHDPFRSRAWGIDNGGQTIVEGQNCNPCPDYGTKDADIDAPEAWDFWQGSADFRVAIIVIDTDGPEAV